MMVYLKYFLNKISDILDSKNSPNNQCKTSLQKITKKNSYISKASSRKKTTLQNLCFLCIFTLISAGVCKKKHTIRTKLAFYVAI